MEPSSTAHSNRVRRLNLIISWLSVLVAASVCGFYVIASQGYFNEVSDTPEYILSAKLLVNGQAGSIYNLEELQRARHQFFPKLRERGLGVLSPPPAILLLLPFALLPTDATASAFWIPVQVAAIALSIWLLRKVYPLPTENLGWFLCWLFMFGPTYECLRIGQITPLLLLALSVLIFCLHKFSQNETTRTQHCRLLAAGLALSAFILKPQEALTLGALMLGAKRWRILGVALVFVGVLCALSCLIMGPSSFSQFLNLYLHLPANSLWMAPELTPTVRGQLLRFASSPLAGFSAIACLTAALVFCVICGRKCPPEADPEAEANIDLSAACVFPLGLLTAYLCHTYDLLLLAPTVMALAYDSLQNRNTYGRSALIAMLICSIPLWLPIYAEINYTYLRGPNVVNPFFLALAGFSWIAVRHLKLVTHKSLTSGS